VLCSQKFHDELSSSQKKMDSNEKNTDREESGAVEKPKEEGIFARHHSALLERLAKELDCEAANIVDADLCLMDACPSSLAGLYNEFISSPRIDNLLSTWAAVQGLCHFAASESDVEKSADICIAASFDHEECGSQSVCGADGQTLPRWLDCLMHCLDITDPTEKAQVYANSYMVSADCAHAFHPNYAAKHQAEHRPEFHKGIVIKTNANQRYATNDTTRALFREVCKQSNVPVQDFVVRNDSPCGTTLGPILAAKLGIRTVDVGAPQWAMHSCRESCASTDAAHLLNMCVGLYQKFRTIDTASRSL